MPAVSVGYEPPYLACWLADNQSRCIVLAKIGHTLHVFKDTYENALVVAETVSISLVLASSFSSPSSSLASIASIHE